MCTASDVIMYTIAAQNESLVMSGPMILSTDLGMIPSDVVDVFILVVFVIFYSIIGVAGICTNLINIVVFVRLGLNDTVNITLLGLSVSDLCFLAMLLWISILHNPAWRFSNVNFDPVELKYLTAGWPISYFNRVSSSITAFLIFTRCLCIVLPLNVKDIVTPRRTSIAIVAIFVTMAITVAPAYFAATYELIFSPSKNRTMLKLVFRDNRAEIDSVSTGISAALTILTFLWVIVCTFILVTSLQRKSKWREKASGGNDSGAMSSRDQRVIKMVIILVVIFIVSFLPETGVIVTMTFEPRFTLGARYNNLFFVMVGVSDTLLAINSSVNIVVYLNMSSKYKECFLNLFKR